MKTYLLHLSNKQAITLDQEDFDKFISQGSEGKLIKLKKGIINPSFVVCILFKGQEETKKEVKGYLDEKRKVFVVTEEKTVPEVKDDFDVQKEVERIGWSKKVS